MPRVIFRCKSCSKELKKFFNSPNSIPKSLTCDCSGELVRQLSSPSQTSVMVIDNGVQAKEVEVNRNIIDIVDDREKSEEKQRGDAEIQRLV